MSALNLGRSGSQVLGGWLYDQTGFVLFGLHQCRVHRPVLADDFFAAFRTAGLNGEAVSPHRLVTT